MKKPAKNPYCYQRLLRHGRKWSLLLLMGLAACHTGSNHAGRTAFTFRDFHATQALNLLASAHLREHILHLTDAAPSVNGLVFFNQKLPLAPGFETVFTFRISGGEGAPDATDGSGGDGFAFIIQNAGATVIPPWIGYMPYQLPGAIAVEFDTWLNGNLGDPDGNHVSIQMVPPQVDALTPFAAFEHRQSVGWSPVPVNLADGMAHEVRLVYRAGWLQVYFDDAQKPLVTAKVNLTTALDKQGRGFIGFAAGTGAAYQAHEILDWSFKTRPR